MHKKESKDSEKAEHMKALPWYLKLYPWYLLTWVIATVGIHAITGIKTSDFGQDLEIIVMFYTAITIPVSLYYVGSEIHPSDLKKSELKKLLDLDKSNERSDHWTWARNIFILVVIITPVLIALVFAPLFVFGLITSAWFAVIIINSVLPVTSSNMFLLPYGIDKKSTAHSVTWTTIICVPIVVLLIALFGIYLV